MPRINRAAQFAPYDALKGLQDALRLEEYKHERILKGEVDEETANRISTNLMNIDKNTVVTLKYFEDGYEKNYCGVVKVDIQNQIIEFNNTKLKFDNLLDLNIFNN